MDWTALLSLLGVVVGAVLGAWLQAMREHRRWLRDTRLERYEAFVTAVNALVVASELGRDWDSEAVQLQAAENVLALIGPGDIYTRAKIAADYGRSYVMNSKAYDAYLNAVAEFNAEARKVLGIPQAATYSAGRN